MANRDNDRHIGRRALIQWGVAASAALGVSKSRLAEIFERAGGQQLAYAATALPTRLLNNRSASAPTSDASLRRLITTPNPLIAMLEAQTTRVRGLRLD